MITYNHPFIKETEIHVFSCFASDVEEFRKGFPKIVPTSMGNKQPFVGYTKKLTVKVMWCMFATGSNSAASI